MTTLRLALLLLLSGCGTTAHVLAVEMTTPMMLGPIRRVGAPPGPCSKPLVLHSESVASDVEVAIPAYNTVATQRFTDPGDSILAPLKGDLDEQHDNLCFDRIYTGAYTFGFLFVSGAKSFVTLNTAEEKP